VGGVSGHQHLYRMSSPARSPSPPAGRILAGPRRPCRRILPSRPLTTNSPPRSDPAVGARLPWLRFSPEVAASRYGSRAGWTKVKDRSWSATRSRFAKELMTLDDISDGRVTAGIGAGGDGFDATALRTVAWLRRERAERSRSSSFSSGSRLRCWSHLIQESAFPIPSGLEPENAMGDRQSQAGDSVSEATTL
jgi:hypothetical protein